MKKKNYLILGDNFIQFCKLNKIEDIEGYASKIFNEAFLRIKYPNPIIEGSTKGNVKTLLVNTRQAPPPPPIQPKVIKEGEQPKPPQNNLYDE